MQLNLFLPSPKWYHRLMRSLKAESPRELAHSILVGTPDALKERAISRQTPSPDFLAFIPHAIEPDWDNVWGSRLAGFPVNIVYSATIEGAGLAQSTYVFDPGTFVDGAQSRQMRYRPTVESDFSALVILHQEGRIETFKYRGSELICEACGPDIRTAMIHTPSGGIAINEPRTTKIGSLEPGDKDCVIRSPRPNWHRRR
jgi:hypothetical protein